MTRKRFVLLASIVTAASLCVVLLPGASATHNNQGTVKVHDDADADPDQRNQPHVSCDFWIEGFNMGDDSGWIEFFDWPPTGTMSPVTPTGDDLNWTADSGNAEDGWGFLKGPYQLPAGHYRVEVYTTDGHPGGMGHFAKAKMFWVDPCDDGEVPPEGEEDVPCPPNVTATVSNDGIMLSWGAVANASGYIVYRDGEELAVVLNATSYLDADVEAGVTYSYTVTAVVGVQESEGCEDVEATAIPFFGPVVGALALAGLVGAFATLRRKL